MSGDNWVNIMISSLLELQRQIKTFLEFAGASGIGINGELAEFLLDFEKKPITYSEVTKDDFVQEYIGKLLGAKAILVGILKNDATKKNSTLANYHRKIIVEVDKCIGLLFDLRQRRDGISKDFNSDYLQTQIKNLTLDIEGLRRQLSSLAGIEENVDKRLDINREEMLSIKHDLLRSYDTFKSNSEEIFNLEIAQLKNKQISAVEGLMDELNSDAAKKSEEGQSKINEMYTKFRAKFDELVATADADAKNLTKMVGALSGQAMAASHLESSINEKNLADAYRIASLVTVGLMVSVVVIYTFFFADLNNPIAFAAKLSIALLFLVPAGYLARESAKHRDVSEYRRHIGINLLALRAYMSDMEPKERSEFKMAMADKLFTNYKYSESGKTLDSFSEIAAAAMQKKQ